MRAARMIFEEKTKKNQKKKKKKRHPAADKTHDPRTRTKTLSL